MPIRGSKRFKKWQNKQSYYNCTCHYCVGTTKEVLMKFKATIYTDSNKPIYNLKREFDCKNENYDIKFMINANELRLGNWWDNGEGKQYIIDTSTMMDFIHEAQMKNGWVDIEPIPLTEDWLIKLGFEKTASTYDFGKLSIHLSGDYYSNGRTYFNSWCIIEKQVEYVHQLQNLYFSLTGQELDLSKG